MAPFACGLRCDRLALRFGLFAVWLCCAIAFGRTSSARAHTPVQRSREMGGLGHW